ncbi:MAG TPA: hypothetical protein VES95_00510 [Dermatophilaceae bacterium]|nr:hypothetical protein [Dermatophilaceae bacterium]
MLQSTNYYRLRVTSDREDSSRVEVTQGPAPGSASASTRGEVAATVTIFTVLNVPLAVQLCAIRSTMEVSTAR